MSVTKSILNQLGELWDFFIYVAEIWTVRRISTSNDLLLAHSHETHYNAVVKKKKTIERINVKRLLIFSIIYCNFPTIEMWLLWLENKKVSFIRNIIHYVNFALCNRIQWYFWIIYYIEKVTQPIFIVSWFNCNDNRYSWFKPIM